MPAHFRRRIRPRPHDDRPEDSPQVAERVADALFRASFAFRARMLATLLRSVGLLALAVRSRGTWCARRPRSPYRSRTPRVRAGTRSTSWSATCSKAIRADSGRFSTSSPSARPDTSLAAVPVSIPLAQHRAVARLAASARVPVLVHAVGLALPQPRVQRVERRDGRGGRAGHERALPDRCFAGDQRDETTRGAHGNRAAYPLRVLSRARARHLPHWLSRKSHRAKKNAARRPRRALDACGQRKAGMRCPYFPSRSESPGTARSRESLTRWNESRVAYFASFQDSRDVPLTRSQSVPRSRSTSSNVRPWYFG